jgi:hypothetical protein
MNSSFRNPIDLPLDPLKRTLLSPLQGRGGVFSDTLKYFRNVLFVLLLSFPHLVQAQLGGQRAFEFLIIPANARLSALGGVNITSGFDDPAMVTSNPAFANSEWHNRLVVNWLDYFADISQYSVTYSREFEKLGVWTANLSYMDYGEFERYDDVGFPLGIFNVAEYVFSLSHSKQFGAFSVGSSLKLAVSDIADYNASAMLFDFGGTFKHPERDLTVGMTVKNLGFMLADYSEESESKLPLDVQLGVTYKPEHMPLRFSLTARNLIRDNATFYDPSSPVSGANEEPSVGDEIFRRLVFGTEIIIDERFQLRVGYNHLLRQELKMESASGGAGFSFGFMMKIKRFEFSYARALYHTAGGSNVLQLNTDLGGLVKKKN